MKPFTFKEKKENPNFRPIHAEFTVEQCSVSFKHSKSYNEFTIPLIQQGSTSGQIGAKEPSRQDFETVPIDNFGKALLRGMGWKDENSSSISLNSENPGEGLIQVRPKGIGLGAEHLIIRKSLNSQYLQIKKGSTVRILAGKHKNAVGVLELFESAGRVTVKLTNGNRVSINESLIENVSKKQ